MRGGTSTERDADALTEVAPPGNEVEEEAASLVGVQGGRRVRVEDVDISHEFGTDFAAAEVVAQGKRGEEQRYGLTLSRASGRWVVVIGENPVGREKSPAAAAET